MDSGLGGGGADSERGLGGADSGHWAQGFSESDGTGSDQSGGVDVQFTTHSCMFIVPDPDSGQ